MTRKELLEAGMNLETGFGESIEEPVVSDDDWELGPACGLDPEVCESCQ